MEEERFTTLNHDHLKRRLPDLFDRVDREEYKKAQAGTSVDDPHGNLFVPAITMGFRNLARLITHTKRTGEILQVCTLLLRAHLQNLTSHAFLARPIPSDLP